MHKRNLLTEIQVTDIRYTDRAVVAAEERLTALPPVRQRSPQVRLAGSGTEEALQQAQVPVEVEVVLEVLVVPAVQVDQVTRVVPRGQHSTTVPVEVEDRRRVLRLTTEV